MGGAYETLGLQVEGAATAMLRGMPTAGKAATYEDLLALPEGARAEIIGGVLVTPPAPLPRHALVQRTAARFIGGTVRRR